MGDALMLGVSGLRGIIGTSLTPEVAGRFASAFGTWVLARKKGTRPATIVLGRDGRRGSDLFASVARAALLSTGCDVLDLDVAMTPTVGVSVDRFGADAGLVVTASHNPQDWCGLKAIVRRPGAKAGSPDAAAPDAQTAAEIIERFHQTPADQASRCLAWHALGTLRVEQELGNSHLHAVREALGQRGVKALARMKVRPVIDNLGMSGAAMSDWAIRQLLARSGPAVDTMFEATADHKQPGKRGIFPHTPEPIAANLKALCARVRASRADVGFAQDPDADRLAIVDEKGRYIGEEYTLVLCAMALAELGALPRGSTIAVNLSTSRMIEDVAAGLGCRVARTAVGEANVVDRMKTARSPIGGEGNGGVIWPAVTYIRDSLGAMSLVLALMNLRRKRISDLVAEVPTYAIVKRKVDLPKREDAQPAVEAVAKAFARERVDRQDGVRVDFASRSAWVHVRASNTEPIMRLIAEAPTVRQAEGLLDETAAVIARGR